MAEDWVAIRKVKWDVYSSDTLTTHCVADNISQTISSGSRQAVAGRHGLISEISCASSVSCELRLHQR